MINFDDLELQVAESDDLDCLEPIDLYDKLIQEFRDYRSRQSNLERRSVAALLTILNYCMNRTAQLSSEPDDTYRTRAAVLVHWTDYTNKVTSELRRRVP